MFTAHGCSTAHNSITLGDWRDPFDPDVDHVITFLISVKHGIDSSSVPHAGVVLYYKEDIVYIVIYEFTDAVG